MKRIRRSSSWRAQGRPGGCPCDSPRRPGARRGRARAAAGRPGARARRARRGRAAAATCRVIWMPLPLTSSVVVSPPIVSSIPRTVTSRRGGDAHELAPLDALDVAVEGDRQRAAASARCSVPPKRWMPRPDVTSTAISWPTRRATRSSLTASATVTVAAVGLVDRRRAACRCARCGRSRAGPSGAWVRERSLQPSWKQLLGERGGVGGRGALARADIGQRAAGGERQLERRAGARGLVGVRERDVRRARAARARRRPRRRRRSSAWPAARGGPRSRRAP